MQNSNSAVFRYVEFVKMQKIKNLTAPGGVRLGGVLGEH
jgi:hypothetical protein